jgi:tetratricopeptide (TPR) repeat protein
VQYTVPFLVRIPLAWLLLAPVLLAQEQDPAADYAARVQAARLSAAKKLMSAGDWAEDKGMHGWAREQFQRAVAADPDNAEARRRLGEKRAEDGKWRIDPSISVKGANARKKDEEIVRIHGEFVRKLLDAERAIGGEWVATGFFADRLGLKAEARAAWQRAVEYAPRNETAR